MFNITQRNWTQVVARRAPFILLAISFLGLLFVYGQNQLGLFIMVESPVEVVGGKKGDGGEVRCKLRYRKENLPSHLANKVAVYQADEALDEADSVAALKSSPPGMYAVSENGKSLWIRPLADESDSLVMRHPIPIPGWLIVIFLSALFGCLAWLFWLPEFRRNLWGRLQRFGSAGGQLITFSQKHPWSWIVVSILFLFVVFHQFILTEVAPYYPRNHDQCSFYEYSYENVDTARTDGVLEPVRRHYFENPGDVFLNSNISVIGGYLMLVFGEERFSALLLHFASFACLIITGFVAFSRVGGSVGSGFLFAGAILLSSMPFVDAGGIADFRIDFVASCWMGISAILWGWFLYRPERKIAWSAAVATGILLWFRILTATYIGLPLLFLLMVFLWSWRKEGSERLAKGVAPVISLGVLTIGIVALGWEFIKDYYISSQVGDAEIVARGADKTWQNGWLEGLSYYPVVAVERHIGTWLFWITVACALISVVMVVFLKRKPNQTSHRSRVTSFVFSLLLVLCPLVVLTVNPHRTAQVVGVVVVPFFVACFPAILSLRGWVSRRNWVSIGLIVFLMGTFSWGSRLQASAPFRYSYYDGELMNSVFFDICSNLREFPPHRRTYAVLEMLDPFAAGPYFFGRERLNQRNPPLPGFPDTIFAMEKEALIDEFVSATLVIIPLDPERIGKGAYPISKSMFEHYDSIVEAVRAEKEFVRKFTFQRIEYEIYVDPK